MNETIPVERLREWVRRLYLYHDMSIGDIALETGTTEPDIRFWAVEGGWEGLKKTLLTSREFQMAQLYKLLETLTEKMKASDDVNPKDADLMVKYTAAIKNLDTETDIPAIVQVARLFTTWLRRKNAALAREVTLHFDAFLRNKLAAVV